MSVMYTSILPSGTLVNLIRGLTESMVSEDGITENGESILLKDYSILRSFTVGSLCLTKLIDEPYEWVFTVTSMFTN